MNCAPLFAVAALVLTVYPVNTVCGSEPNRAVPGMIAQAHPLPKGTLAVKGSLLDKDTQQPLGGGCVVLCRKKEQAPECTIDSALTSVTDRAGLFEIKRIVPGEYVILYNLSGRVNDAWQGMRLDYSPTMYAARPGGVVGNLSASMGTELAPVGKLNLSLLEGKFAFDGYLYAKEVDLALIITPKGLKSVMIRSDTPPIKVFVPGKMNY